MKHTNWIYIGIMAIVIATLFTFATADLSASMYVWIYGWAVLCVLYPIVHWLEKRKKKPSEKPEKQVKTKTRKQRKSGIVKKPASVKHG